MHNVLAILIQWITPTQSLAFKDWIVAPVVGAAVLALLQRAITSSRAKIHEMMTANANRTRDELIEHFDAKFKSHETAAFAKLAVQDEAIKELNDKLIDLQVQIKQLSDSLRR